MTLQEIRQALLELTQMRECVSIYYIDQAISVFEEKFEVPPIVIDIEAKRTRLERDLESFYIIWDDVNHRFGLIPKLLGSQAQ